MGLVDPVYRRNDIVETASSKWHRRNDIVKTAIGETAIVTVSLRRDRTQNPQVVNRLPTKLFSTIFSTKCLRSNFIISASCLRVNQSEENYFNFDYVTNFF